MDNGTRDQLLGRLAEVDRRIFVSAKFEETLARARRRDLVPLGSAARVEQRFRNRYLPSQQRYFDAVRPTDLADTVVHNVTIKALQKVLAPRCFS